MPRKTHSIERLGINVYGRSTKTKAEKAWAEARDHYLDKLDTCGVWTFAYNGFVAVLQPTQGDGWSYTLVSPADSGPRGQSCFFNADGVRMAICETIGALAQFAWSPEVKDDAAYFDDMIRLARTTDTEAAASNRDNFLTIAAHWRAHMANKAA